VSDQPKPISSADLSDALQELVNLAQVPRPDPPFKQLLTDHFGADPSGLPSIVENFDLTDHPNLQIALDAYLEGEGRSGTTLGITSPHKRYMGIGLSDLVGARSTDDAPTPARSSTSPSHWAMTRSLRAFGTVSISYGTVRDR